MTIANHFQRDKPVDIRELCVSLRTNRGPATPRLCPPRVLFLSGAGISAESGIGTFRDSGGLWETYNVMEVCSAEAFRKNRAFVLGFYDKRRADLADKVPNAAHTMIAELEREFGDRICNITQNIDDLFEKAGCRSVIHLHGELTKARCESCGTLWSVGYGQIIGNEQCPRCAMSKTRHHVVMFHESAPEYARLYEELARVAKSDGMLVVIGTSGIVLPVEDFARAVPRSVLNNLEPQDSIRGDFFDRVFYEPAGSAAPKIQALVKEFLQS